MKIVACDPGESFGYCVGEDEKLYYSGQVELWDFVHALGVVLGVEADYSTSPDIDPELKRRLAGVNQVVIEDWVIYPWVAEQGGLNYDKCRTARAIGALEYICRASETPYVLQGAKIKDTAQAAGVENLYVKPVHDNRHQNDAMQHYVFFNLGRGKPPVHWAKEGVAA